MINGDIKDLRRLATTLRDTTLNGVSLQYAGNILDKLIDEILSKPAKK